MGLQELRSTVERLRGQRDAAVAREEALSKEVRVLERKAIHIDKARAVLQAVAKKTQDQLRFRIEEIVSLALDSVFDQPYEFLVEFVETRGKTECLLTFYRDKKKLEDPMDEAGGGPLDVASFALRVALWGIQQNPSLRNVLVLDEPFRNLDALRQPRASLMLREVSHRLGIQIIMTTHSAALIKGADAVFEVSLHKGVSKVEEG